MTFYKENQYNFMYYNKIQLVIISIKKNNMIHDSKNKNNKFKIKRKIYKK